MQLTSKNQEYLSEIFSQFAKTEVPAVMVRNYEGLPKFYSGNDIDILCTRETLSLWIEKLTHNFPKFEVLAEYPYCVKTAIHSDGQKILIDLNFKQNWYGIPLLHDEEIYADLVEVAPNIFRPPEHIASLITLFHSLIYGGFINYKYESDIIVLLKNKNFLKEKLNYLFGRGIANILIRRIERRSQISRLEANIFRLYLLLRVKLLSRLHRVNVFK